VHDKRLIIVTGMAGAGKTVAIRALEDLGYYCVDNLPSPLIPGFVEAFTQGTLAAKQVGLALDSRDSHSQQTLVQHLPILKREAEVDILFLEANEDVVVKRFRETRRTHPLTMGSLGASMLNLGEAIRLDTELLMTLRAFATRILDTSHMSSDYLRKLIRHDYAKMANDSEVLFNIISFGFKYGMPGDVDTVFDVRCFANPHYIAHLRPLTGLTPEVQEFVFSDSNVEFFIQKVVGLMELLYPLYKNEGKRYFGIGVGCTGGKHRSVAIAQELAKRMGAFVPLVSVEHRHFDKE
jgi:RNase adapter protein RapZ